MHNGRVATSERLQRVLAVLRDGREHSSMEIVREAGVVAPGTCVSELRANGAKIDCRVDTKDGERVWYYRLTEAPADA